MAKPALLVLEDGTIFRGQSIGHAENSVGEVVFNTSMTGYQEILTDPSYAEQIICLTYPHIGNVGCNAEDTESNQIWSKGLIIRDLSLVASNWRSEISLQNYLEAKKITGIANIDTRRLTRILREKGAQAGCITTDVDNPDAAIQSARDFPGLKGMDLAQKVTTKKKYEWTQTTWGTEPAKENKTHIIAYDFGVKQNILRLLADRNCKVTVVPAQTPASEVLAAKPHGVFLSNGPGDPEPCDYAIKAIKELLAARMPIFGICLGFQLLALACGARSTKMKFGHHGANHPVLSERDGKVLISSQNHGFAIKEDTLPANLTITHRSLFDGTLQGIQHTETPAFGFQGHPEASPGPHDLMALFDEFAKMISQ